ncbi:MAG: aldo/keto reductase [Rhodobacteraceae bacterium]|jgi:aryl-alcohol dehydrogenase-like predicted oxidoreductase|nr:aldo/keto reductase [Paracoccaceae bacterium]
MKMIPLGRTGLTVSELCLGTMTWGSMNDEAEGHAQADLAFDRGVTFWDTAEMYPVAPVRAETAGQTETIIGNWLAARGGRSRLVIATKAAGRGEILRPGEPVTGRSLRAALEGSLRRLRTDYVDLYQIHWPNRGSYHFRKIWDYAPRAIDKAAETAQMTDILTTAKTLIDEGKIRAIGLSNETVWGAARWLHLADTLGLPRMATVQNEYSLLCRQFDSDWAELSLVEDMPLLAFSPLAAGLLTGKYAGDVTPEGTRRARTPDLGGRITARVFPAVAAYLGVAARHGLNPCQMAIAFCRGRPFATIPILGATSVEQLETDLGAEGLVLPPEVLADIDAVHRAYPMPY